MINLEEIEYILTIDLEMTCDDHPHFTGQDQEIIEVGWVLQKLNYTTVSSGNFFVKPLIKPVITEYCTKLTGITPEDIEDRFPLKTEVARWLPELPKSSSIIMAAWGADPDWLRQELKDQGGNYPFFEEFINVKLVDNSLHGRRGLKAAVYELGIEMELPQHRALPDAITTTRIMEYLKIGTMDYQVSNDGTYRQLVTRQQKDKIDKFVKRTKLSVADAKKVLEYVNYDFTKAINIFKIIKS